MTIKYLHGDLLKDSAEAYVNTVNCVGVMGKGIALAFKNRWPENYKHYKLACNAKFLRPGKMLVWKNESLLMEGEPRYIINFPTKDHWRKNSEISYIEQGLEALKATIAELNIKSLAIPPLGCGNGGLDWSVVKPLIISNLSSLEGVDIHLYLPNSDNEPDPPEQYGPEIRMTYERAIFVKSVSKVEPYFYGEIDELSLQKIAYLLQQLGLRLNLDFNWQIWGPYSSALRNAFKFMCKMNIFGNSGEDDKFYHVTRSGFAAADDYIQSNELNDAIVDRLADLIEGFENPYGLELLAKAHMFSIRQVDNIVETINAPQKRAHSYKEEEIALGIKRLNDFGLINSIS